VLSDCLQPRAQWHWLRAMPWVPIGYCDPDYGSRNSNSDPDVIITDKRCCTSEPRRLMRLQRVHDRRCRVPGAGLESRTPGRKNKILRLPVTSPHGSRGRSTYSMTYQSSM
jgi:hypothetical protein